MIALVTMIGCGLVFLVTGVYLSLSMGQEAVQESIDRVAGGEPRLN